MIVLIAVTEKQVVITDQFNTAQITGKNSIFNKVTLPTTTAYDIEIVGIYTSLEIASTAREAHTRAHPGRKYIQKVAQLNDGLDTTPPEPPKCITCGTPTAGLSFCGPCQKAHWEHCNDLDPLNGAGDNVPMVKV